MSLAGSRPTQDASPSPPRVEEAVPCAECAYNLIGQLQSGRCPECGYSVDESIRAGGFWTHQRIRSLRRACWLFAVSVPSWSIAAGISRVASPSPALRSIVVVLAVIHIGSLLISAYLGLGASSRLTRQFRLLLLCIVTAIVGAVMMIPLLVVSGWLGQVSTGVLALANITRLLLVLLSAWWITSGTKSLRPMWTGTILTQRITMIVLVAGWGPLAFQLLFRGVPATMSPLLQTLGSVAVATEAAAALLLVTVTLLLAASLGRAPRRVSYASE